MADVRRSRAAGIAFLAAVAVFAWLGLRGRFDEVADAVRDTPLLGALGAVALVALGVFVTGLVWLRVMAGLGARLPLVDGLATFFVGQLGKYIPGSVWSIGAQAELARRHQAPPRSTVTAGLVFLGYHVATAGVVAGAALLAGAVESHWPRWLTALGVVAAALGMLPAVVRVLASRISGQRMDLGLADTARTLVAMAVTWTLYAAALVLLSPGQPWRHLLAYGGAFAAAYAVGVVVVFAPAGLGAREGTFVLLLAPLVGVSQATALALLARVVHTVVDGAMAASWWAAARPTGTGLSRPGSGADPAGR